MSDCEILLIEYKTVGLVPEKGPGKKRGKKHEKGRKDTTHNYWKKEINEKFSPQIEKVLNEGSIAKMELPLNTLK